MVRLSVLVASLTPTGWRVGCPRSSAGTRPIESDLACYLHARHLFAYNFTMTLIQVRDVPEETVNALKARAAARGLTLASYLRGEFERLAARPSNAEIAERLARRNRRGGPSAADTVAEIRRTREAS